MSSRWDVSHTRLVTRHLFPLLFVVAIPAVAFAQDEVTLAPGDTLLEVRLADGSTVFGRIVQVEGDRVVIVSEAGARVEIDRGQIVSARPFRGTLRAGEAWPEDEGLGRLFFATTGRTQARGRGTFGVFELFLPFLSYGITDRVTISGGTPIAPEIMGEVFYLSSKIGVVRGARTNVAVGVLAFFATAEPDDSAGVLYGAGTFGGPDRSVTVGAGWPFIRSDAEDDITDRPSLMAGWDVRLSRHARLISENHFFAGENESGALLSAGIRFFGERLSADVGVGVAVGEDAACCLPIVNFAYGFGGD